jgi:hypothetical protein
MDSFTSFDAFNEVTLDTFGILDVSQALHESPTNDTPIDQERYGAGNTSAFCVIA